MMRSCLPQTSSVGAAMRCVRFFNPRSGSGQTNLPVQACDQTNWARTSTRSAGSLGAPKNRRAASPSGLANSYGARTVAKGVESRTDFLAALEMGFDLAQGYLFGKPAGVKKFARSTLARPVSMPQ